jgi:hypothetical protein
MLLKSAAAAATADANFTAFICWSKYSSIVSAVEHHEPPSVLLVEKLIEHQPEYIHL